MRGEGVVAGEGRVVGIPKFHSWDKCTMPLTNSTQTGCPTLPLACVLTYIIYITRVLYFASWGVIFFVQTTLSNNDISKTVQVLTVILSRN